MPSSGHAPQYPMNLDEICRGWFDPVPNRHQIFPDKAPQLLRTSTGMSLSDKQVSPCSIIRSYSSARALVTSFLTHWRLIANPANCAA